MSARIFPRNLLSQTVQLRLLQVRPCWPIVSGQSRGLHWGLCHGSEALSLHEGQKVCVGTFGSDLSAILLGRMRLSASALVQ